jgi:hypothetical protein
VSHTEHEPGRDESTETINLLLTEALRKIEKDLSLRTSVTELARQANVHRNTIYHRKWPLEKLAAIKEKRAQQKIEQALLQASELSPEKLLEQSRLEIIYWFTQLQDARSSNTLMIKKTKETEASRDFYVKLATDRLMVINKQKTEIRKLQDALTLIEEEFSQRDANPTQKGNPS